MITASITPWEPLNGVEQIATTWKISKNEEMTEIIYSNKNTNVDTMYFLFAFLLIPKDETVWIQATRHFNDGNIDYAMDPMSKTNIDQEVSNMLQQPDIFIDTPMLYVDEAELMDISKSHFTVRTSKYRGNYSAHLFTHWIVKDDLDNVLFVSLNDKGNLREISIDKDIMFNTDIRIPSEIQLNKDLIKRNKSRLIIHAIHGTNNNIESKVGKTYVVMGSVNFKIISNISHVEHLADYRLVIDTIDKSKPSYITNIAIKDLEEEKTYWQTKVREDDELTFTVPWYVFAPNTKYVLVITATTLLGVVIDYKEILRTRQTKLLDTPNVHFSNTKELELIENNDTVINGNVTTIELLNKTIPIPKDDTLVLYKFNPLTNILTNTDTILEGINLLSDNNRYTYIKYLESNLLFIDTYNSNGNPTFLVYYHNVSNNVYSLLHTYTRENETHPIGINNGIVQITQDTFMYIPYKRVEEGIKYKPYLCSYNVSTNEHKEIIQLPFDHVSNGSIIKINNNKLLLLSGNDFLTYVYNINGNYLIDGITITPRTFINPNTQVRQLINGSTIFYKNKYDSLDKQISILYFNYETSRMERLSLQFKKNMFPSGSILLLNGSLLFYTTNVIRIENTDEFKTTTELQLFN